ncbi:unnamed protein product [Closterium sp. NIES-54]
MKRRGRSKYRHPPRPLYNIFCILSCAAIVAAASNAPSLTESPSTPSTSIKSAYNGADPPRDLPVRSTPLTRRFASGLIRTAWPRLHLNRTLRSSVNSIPPPFKGIGGSSIRSINSSFEHSRRALQARLKQPNTSAATAVRLRPSNVAPTATRPSSIRSSNSSFERSRRALQARLKQPINSDPTTVSRRPNIVAPTATRSPSQLPVIPSDLGPEIKSYCGQGVCAKDPKWCGVMNNPIRIYLVWYGSFSDAQKNLLRTFIHSFSSTEGTVADWWRTNTLYYDCYSRYVSSSVTLAREHHVRQPLRLLYGLKSIKRVIKKRMNSGAFPLDENGVYFVIGDSSVAQRDSSGGMCSTYCGWHDFVRIRKKLIKVAYVGSPTKCPSSCWLAAFAFNDSPNMDKSFDSLLSTFAHELAEATSDPYVTNWYDALGQENGDLCAWKTGTLSYTADAAPYNVEGVGGTKFLIQQNYDPNQRTCVIATAVLPRLSRQSIEAPQTRWEQERATEAKREGACESKRVQEGERVSKSKRERARSKREEERAREGASEGKGSQQRDQERARESNRGLTRAQERAREGRREREKADRA